MSTVDWRDMVSALDFETRRNLHRPSDPLALELEVRRLAGTGLTPIDVATALRLDVAMVRQVLAQGRGS